MKLFADVTMATARPEMMLGSGSVIAASVSDIMEVVE
jgi:hypothetical protein